MSDSASSMCYSTTVLFMAAVGKMQFLQWEPVALLSRACVRMSWVCSWMSPREKQ